MKIQAALATLILSTVTVHALDWPQYRGATGDGRTAEKVVKPWPATGPKVLWKVPTPGGFSSFSVAGGRAFTLVLREIEGANQETLLALDANTGKEAWAVPMGAVKFDGGGDSGADNNKGGDGPRSTPTSDGAHVFTLSSKLVLQSFDAASGKVAWTKDIIAEHAGRNIQWQSAASPLLEGGLLFVAGGGAEQSLIAVDAKDGHVVWKAFDEKMTHATPVPATILGQRQVIFFLQSGLLAVEPKTGRELWRYNFNYSTSTAASPVVSGDIVYCSAGYGVGAGAARITKSGDTFTATEIYRMRGNKPLANHWSTPIVKDGHLYGLFQFKEYGSGPMKCIDLVNGTVKWEQPGFGPGQVISAGGQVIALSDAGELVLIDAKPDAYKQLARADVLDGKCWSTPVLANGRIFARSTKEAVCLDVSGK